MSAPNAQRNPILFTNQETAVDVKSGVLSSAFRRFLSRLLLVIPIQGIGTPEGVITASPGKLYTDLNGGANLTLYVKESGVDSNTGWIAK